MTVLQIQEKLFLLQDLGYKAFNAKLIPNIPADSMIGIRTPALKKLAKELCKENDVELFLKELPHKYFEENQLHAFIISEQKDFDLCLQLVEQFLPYVNNWGTCDQLLPKAFKKSPEPLIPHIKRWICSDHTYTVRFAIGLLMQFFLEDRFLLEYPELVCTVKSDEYYINMMIAWYFATALCKQYKAILPFIEQKRLSPWTHNKTIQKSIESYRITPEQKEYLRTLKVSVHH